MLRSQGLTFAYSNGPTLTLPDIHLDDGEQVLILGPSGSGKSTLLGLWAGLLTPTTGEIVIDNTNVHTLRARARDHWRGEHIGLVFQSARLIDSQTVRANIQLPDKLAGREVDNAHTQRLLQLLNIEHLAERYPAECSIGEQQRVGILRALHHRPTLLLADEPTSALDTANAHAVADLLIEQAQRQNAMLAVVTHDDRLRDRFERTITL